MAKMKNLLCKKNEAGLRSHFISRGWVFGSFRVFLFFCLFSLFALHSSPVFANALTISNVSLENNNSTTDTVTVQFDISWENSWRLNTAPANWDAVWLFLKVKKSGAWYHGMLKTAGTDPSDTDPGSDTDLMISVPSDKVGAFIYRGSTGTGTVSSTDVELTLDYAAAPLSAGDTDTIQVKVFGIEMVHVSEGDFYIGDGNGSNESKYAFHSGATNNALQLASTLTNDIRVDSGAGNDAQLYAVGIGVDGDGGLDTDDNGSVDNANFPTGWTAFYMMKYPITQGQWRDFLNTLTRDEQDNRTGSDVSGDTITNSFVMANTSVLEYRQGVKAPASGNGTSDPVVFGCDLDDDDSFNETTDGEWIAMNYLSWMDLCAYADWAGLRPMTELEYEKACRGPETPVYGEFAWGLTDATQAQGAISNSGQDGEVASNTGQGLALYNGPGTDINGPLRVGFQATSGTTRGTAAAGYYGGMNMSEGLRQWIVTVGNADGRAFDGSNGDGVLTSDSGYEGNATNTGWPGINATTTRGVTGVTGAGVRGTPFSYLSTNMPTSFRQYAVSSNSGRNQAYGGRLVRTYGGGFPDGWWNTDWLYRRSITIDNTNVDSTLTDFPLLVKLSSTTMDFSHAQSDGADVRFTDDAGSPAELDYEIERWSTASEAAEVWVNVPSISSSSPTTIYMYYGNAATTTAENAAGVFNHSQLDVWHMGEGTGSVVADSLSGTDGTKDSGINWTSSGQIGNAIVMANANYVTFDTQDPPWEGQSVLTFTTWAKAASAQATNDEYWAYQFNAGNYAFGLGRIDYPYERMQFYVGATGGQDYAGGSGAELNDTNWHFFVGTYDGTTITLYMDNTAKGSTGSTSGTISDQAAYFMLDGDDATGMELDDMTVYNRVITAAERKFLYYNQKASANELTIGSEGP